MGLGRPRSTQTSRAERESRRCAPPCAQTPEVLTHTIAPSWQSHGRKSAFMSLRDGAEPPERHAQPVGPTKMPQHERSGRHAGHSKGINYLSKAVEGPASGPMHTSCGHGRSRMATYALKLSTRGNSLARPSHRFDSARHSLSMALI